MIAEQKAEEARQAALLAEQKAKAAAAKAEEEARIAAAKAEEIAKLRAKTLGTDIAKDTAAVKKEEPAPVTPVATGRPGSSTPARPAAKIAE